jgi:hypothetical protein
MRKRTKGDGFQIAAGALARKSRRRQVMPACLTKARQSDAASVFTATSHAGGGRDQ